MPPPPDIPGFYFDPSKKRYFKITNGGLQQNSQYHNNVIQNKKRKSENDKIIEREQKKLQLGEVKKDPAGLSKKIYYQKMIRGNIPIRNIDHITWDAMMYSKFNNYRSLSNISCLRPKNFKAFESLHHVEYNDAAIVGFIRVDNVEYTLSAIERKIRIRATETFAKGLNILDSSEELRACFQDYMPNTTYAYKIDNIFTYHDLSLISYEFDDWCQHVLLRWVLKKDDFDNYSIIPIQIGVLRKTHKDYQVSLKQKLVMISRATILVFIIKDDCLIEQECFYRYLSDKTVSNSNPVKSFDTLIKDGMEMGHSRLESTNFAHESSLISMDEDADTNHNSDNAELDVALQPRCKSFMKFELIKIYDNEFFIFVPLSHTGSRKLVFSKLSSSADSLQNFIIYHEDKIRDFFVLETDDPRFFDVLVIGMKSITIFNLEYSTMIKFRYKSPKKSSRKVTYINNNFSGSKFLAIIDGNLILRNSNTSFQITSLLDPQLIPYIYDIDIASEIKCVYPVKVDGGFFLFITGEKLLTVFT